MASRNHPLLQHTTKHTATHCNTQFLLCKTASMNCPSSNTLQHTLQNTPQLTLQHTIPTQRNGLIKPLPPQAVHWIIYLKKKTLPSVSSSHYPSKNLSKKKQHNIPTQRNGPSSLSYPSENPSKKKNVIPTQRNGFIEAITLKLSIG